jgi:uncharacterized protein YbcI
MIGTSERQTHALAEITRGLAVLHMDYYGKGPRKASSYMVDDTVVCFLEGGFTTVERTLIDQGNAKAVHEIRRSFQATMEGPFRAVVENATGRKVDAYMSQMHTDPDLAVELFMLEPAPDGLVGGARGGAPCTGGWQVMPTMEGMRQGSAKGEVLAQISTGLVQLHRRYYGKGPTKAKTYLVNDTVICVLRGGFTTVERTLIDDGIVDPVYIMRRSFQSAMETNFKHVVEEAIGREVIAYMSQIHHDPDLAVELFVLEPTGEPMDDEPSAVHQEDQAVRQS